MHTIDFYYDFRSPYAYFASCRLSTVFADTNVKWNPVSIDVLLNLQADRDPWADYIDPLPLPKRAHLITDVGRMAAFWKIPLKPPVPARPASKDAMSIAALLAEADIDHAPFRTRAFAALWQQQKDLAAPDVIAEVADGFNWETLGGLENGVNQLTQNTIDAYRSGVYGVPTFIFRDQLYFGADRMDVLAANL